MKLPVLLTNGQVVDARVARRHQAVFIELPVLIAERPEPVARIVVPFVREANPDPIVD
jgi:hypothetical protein